MRRLIGIGSKIERIDDFSVIGMGIGIDVFMKNALFEKRFLFMHLYKNVKVDKTLDMVSFHDRTAFW